jgi:hypothetical protein
MPAKAQWYSTMSRGCRFYRIPPRKPAALRRGATCRPPPAKESRPRATALNFREITCCGRSDGVIVMVYEVSPVCLVRRSAGVRRGWWCRCGRLGCARSARRVRDVRAAIPGLACTGGGNGTAASRYTRRYTHDLEQQRRSPITCGSPRSDVSTESSTDQPFGRPHSVEAFDLSVWSSQHFPARSSRPVKYSRLKSQSSGGRPSRPSRTVR